jgi:Putative prokaryotic signal transducing protein
MTIHGWVRVDGYTDIIQANIVRGRLEVEGIPAMLANEHTVTADWLYSQLLGGVSVMVPPQYLQAAREVIRQIDTGAFEEHEDNAIESHQDVCSKCKTPLRRNESVSWKFSLISSLLFFIPIPFRRHRFDCSECQKALSQSELLKS